MSSAFRPWTTLALVTIVAVIVVIVVVVATFIAAAFGTAATGNWQLATKTGQVGAAESSPNHFDRYLCGIQIKQIVNQPN